MIVKMREWRVRTVIQNHGWLLFYKHPKAAAMTVVCEFFANAPEGPSNYKVFVRGKEVKYDTTTINNLLRLQYNPTGQDEVEYLLNDSANMVEVTRVICQSRGT